MAIDLTLEGTISGLFDHLASYFNYDIESPHAVEFDIAQDLIGFVQNAFEDNGSDSHAYCLRLHCDDDNFDSFFKVSVKQWLDLLAKDLLQYTDPTVRSPLHALYECLYAYLNDIDALEMVRDVEFS